MSDLSLTLVPVCRGAGWRLPKRSRHIGVGGGVNMQVPCCPSLAIGHRTLEEPLKSGFKFMIRTYQVILSPLLGNRCRFYPSCSRYALLTLEQDSLTKALTKIAGRIARCNPWNPGGVDLP